MNVAELIAALKQLDPLAQVFLAQDPKMMVLQPLIPDLVAEELVTIDGSHNFPTRPIVVLRPERSFIVPNDRQTVLFKSLLNGR